MMDWRPDRAMVLAAGYGKRMLPLSESTPKPLIPVAGKPLIDHCLDELADFGISQAVVNVYHLAEKVEAHLNRRSAPQTIVSDERDGLLDTGGGTARALPHFAGQAFLVRNSDSFWINGYRSNLDWLAGAWSDETMDALLLLATTVTASSYRGKGDFLLEKDGRLVRRPEREIAPFVYAGAAILHPRLFDSSDTGAFSLNRLFDRAIGTGRLFGVRMDGIWINVENPAAIGVAESALAGHAA